MAFLRLYNSHPGGRHWRGFPSIKYSETRPSSVGEESACNEGDRGSNPGLGRSLGEGKGYPLQYSSLE